MFMYDKNSEVPVHHSLQHSKKIEQSHNYNTRLAARCNYLIPKKGQTMEKKKLFRTLDPNMANNTN